MGTLDFLSSGNENMKPKPLVIIGLTILMLGIAPLLAASIIYIGFYIGLITFCILKLIRKVNYLYVSILLLVLSNFIGQIYYSLFGTSDLGILSGTLAILGIIINLIVLIAGIYRAAKMKDYISNFVYLATNIIIVGAIYMFSKSLIIQYGSEITYTYTTDYFFYIFATYIVIIVLILFTKKYTFKYKEINLFK